MIASIKGNLASNTGDYLLIETQSGLGYKVYISSETATGYFGKENQEIHLFTYLSVKEDALDLYGFETTAETEFFQNLISVSGVGPKSALGILSIAPLDVIQSAIAAGDISYLTKVSGIGKKSAQKIILELQDKIAKELELTGGATTVHKDNNDVMEALLSLGYQKNEAREAISNIPDTIESTQEKLRHALKALQS